MKVEEVTYSEQCLLHVQVHFVVVETHDPDKTLKGADLYLRARVLSGLTDDLHDVVALALALKVLANKLERVVEGVDRGELDFR